MSLFIHENSDEQAGYHASHVTHVRQMVIIHHLHVMHPHIHHMPVSINIEEGNETIKALNQTINEVINQSNNKSR